VSDGGEKFQSANEECHPFIPIFFRANVIGIMDPSTPRFAGLTLRLVESALRTTPLPRWLSRLVVERKLADIDFAAEGEPAPFYMPQHYIRKHRT
jgi:hypothetical protein